MNFEELHNDLNSFPDDLKYQDAHWDGALSLIESYEKKQTRKRRVFGAFSFFVVFGVVLFALQTPQSALTEYTPRSGNTFEFSFEEMSSDEFMFREKSANQLEAYAQDSKDSKSTLNDYSDLTSKFDQSISKIVQEGKEGGVIAVFEEPEELSEADVKGYDYEESTAEKKSMATKSDHSDKSEPFIDVFQSDIINDQLVFNEDENVKPEFMKSIFSSLKSKGFSSRPLGDKLKIKIAKEFYVYSEFLALNIGVSPWAEFGRVNKFGNLDLNGGAFYEKRISPSINMNIGLNYSSVSAIDASVSSTQTTYGFGYESNITVVHTNKIHLIDLPLNVLYRIKPRVQFSAGLGATYLLNSENTLEEHRETNEGSSLLKSQETKGYVTSFNSVLVNSRIGAYYWLNPKTRLGVNYEFGLSDFTKNEVFGDELRHRNSRLNLTLAKVIR